MPRATTGYNSTTSLISPLAEMSSVTMHARWIDPLALHDRWKPQFMLLCEKLAVDLEKGLDRTRR
ncbi:MAG: hypothetical protein IPM07_24105 [Anaerolineales bacterium]|nr:hypothetical protein [Anaerolineales bacterium]